MKEKKDTLPLLRFEVERVEKIRLDRWLSEKLPEFSRSFWQRKIREGAVRVDGVIVDPREILVEGRVVEVEKVLFSKSLQSQDSPQPEEIPLYVLWEDEDILVINKIPGMVVHPGNGSEAGTVVNAALHLCGSLPVLSEADRPGIVHRLDKETSGVLILAKTEKSGSELLRQFREREIKKQYLAVVQGVPPVPQGSCFGKIGRHPVRRTRMAITNDGRTATSHWNLLGAAPADNWSLLEISIETGRTHQIRVHLSAEGYPVIGDPLYGYRKKRSGGLSLDANRVLLHAFRIEFDHPITGNSMRVEAPLPSDMAPFADEMAKKS